MLNKRPTKRRSRIAHHPRIETVDKSKSVERLFLDKFLTLIVISLPLSYFVFIGNATLAEYNTRMKEYEHQRYSWEKLESDLTKEADSYFVHINDNLNNYDSEYNDHSSPSHLPHTRLRYTINRIRLYGEHLRDPCFLAYCNVVDDSLQALEWERFAYFKFRDNPDVANAAIVERVAPSGAIIHTATNNERLLSSFRSEYNTLSIKINQLSLMIFDPSYVPYELRNGDDN